MALANVVEFIHVNRDVLTDFIGGKTWKCLLCSDVILSTDVNISSLTELATGNGYSAGGASITVAAVQDGIDAYLSVTQPTFTAAGGNIGPYRGIAIYAVATGRLLAGYNEIANTTILNGNARTIELNQPTGALFLGT